MADVSITAGNVRWVSGPTEVCTAGAAFTAGQVVAMDTDNTVKACDSNSATAALRKPYGVVLGGGLASGQPVLLAKPGAVVNMGATLTVGEPYYTSPNGGGLAPHADIATGHYTGLVGIAQTAANLLLVLAYGATAHA